MLAAPVNCGAPVGVGGTLYTMSVNGHGQWIVCNGSLPSGSNWSVGWGSNTGGGASVDGNSAPRENEISSCTRRVVCQGTLTGQQQRRP